MKLLRAAAIALLAALALVLGLVGAVMHNQAAVVSLVLRHVQERTGYQILAADSRLRFGVHLNVVLDHASIRHDGQELFSSERVHVILSYHALIWSNGLPLRGVIVTRPQFRAPVAPGSASLATLPRPDSSMLRTVAAEFRDFSGLVERVTIADARVIDSGGTPLLDDFSLTAAPQHRRLANWTVGFIAPHIETSLAGLEMSGRMSIDTAAQGADQIVSQGQLWFWDGRLDRSAAAGITAKGLVHGAATFVVRGRGEIDGRGEVQVDNLRFAGSRLSAPLDLGDCSLEALYAISAQRFALAGLEAKARGTTLFEGDLTLANPYEESGTLLAHLSGMQADLAALRARLTIVRDLPSPLPQLASMLVSGQVAVEGASYEAPLKVALTPAALLDGLTASARLQAVSITPPPATKLPALSRIEVQLAYAQRRLTISQGSAVLGRSLLEQLDGSAGFGRGLRKLPYKLKLAGKLDLEETFRNAIQLFPALGARAAGHIKTLTGSAAVRATISGALDVQSPAPPTNYSVNVDTSGFSFAAKDLPRSIAFAGGSVTIAPGDVEFKRVMATVATPNIPGEVALDGALAFDSGGLHIRRIGVEIHQVEAQQWLPLLVDPDDLAARGSISGALMIERRPGHRDGTRTSGRITMGAGEVRLGFLRSPIVDQSVTLTLDGHGLLVAIPGSKLEGEPLNLSLALPDLDRPSLKIDATAGQLDLEVMKFIRLPWAPSPPAHFFSVPVSGHIVANQAKLERLAMSRVSCDFARKVDGDWEVRNFRANIYEGRADVEFSGRGRDNWVNIKGHFSEVRVAALFKLANPQEESPLSGRLNATADLWADTDTDFFRTLAGSISTEVSDGVLHKFTLLSRVLSLIDLKTWLSAQAFDPRVNGVPFQSLSANFKGSGGDFYTDDLQLQGPVMNIYARGNVHLDNGDVNLEIGMVPFKTVNWLMAKLPIIGQGLGTSHILAAYFRVSGLLSDPRVRPMPIASVEHFFTNILKIPINIFNGAGGNSNSK